MAEISFPKGLAEMWARDEALGIDPRAPTRVIDVPAPPPAAQSLRIEPPDWDREHREFLARERAEKERAARELVAELEGPEPEKPTPPAQPAARPRRRWKADK